MEPMENCRVSDQELVKLIDRVLDLEAEVHKLRGELEQHKELDDQTHAKMMQEMVVVQSKIDIIMKELVAHTSAEEKKFDTIIRNQEQHGVKLSKLITDTEPAIALTNTGKYLGMLVKFMKDVVVPVMAGGAIVYAVLVEKLPITFRSTTTEQGQKQTP